MKDRRAQMLAENQRLILKSMTRLTQIIKSEIKGAHTMTDLDELAITLSKRADQLDALIEHGFYTDTIKFLGGPAGPLVAPD